MARFQFDENVDYDIALALAGLGQNVMTARDPGLDGIDDDEQLLAATGGGRTLVTHNGKDFILLHPAWRRWSRAWGVPVSQAGILIVPQMQQVPPDMAAQAIDAIQSRVPLANELYAYEWRQLHDWEHKPVP